MYMQHVEIISDFMVKSLTFLHPRRPREGVALESKYLIFIDARVEKSRVAVLLEVIFLQKTD